MGWLSLLTKGKKVAGAIKSFRPAKNLTKRRADFEDIVKTVDKTRTKFNLPKTDKSSKIKRDAAIKISKIHDKYENLSKILKKK
jgi:hypothetical protein